MNNIEVVYTLFANLKKTGDMMVGQVGFHKQKEVLCQLSGRFSLHELISLAVREGPHITR
jgi:hypothetical protein